MDAIPHGAVRGVLLDYGNVLAGIHCGDLAEVVAAHGGRGRRERRGGGPGAGVRGP